MKLFNWLFGKSDSSNQQKSKELITRITKRILDEKGETGKINKHTMTEVSSEIYEAMLSGGFFYDAGIEMTPQYEEVDVEKIKGNSRRSKDGTFAVRYQDGDQERSGHVALISGNSLFFNKAVRRPDCCEVSNNGIVVCSDLVDWDGNDGHFLVFSKEGDVIFEKKLKANIGTCGISPDGNYAIYETFYSSTEHGDRFYIIDIKAKKMIKWAKKEVWQPSHYSFEPFLNLVRIKNKDNIQVIKYR